MLETEESDEMKLVIKRNAFKRKSFEKLEGMK